MTAFGCDHCGRETQDPEDVANRYCRHCHHFCEDIERQIAEGLVSFCFCHYVVEPIPGDVYRICFECKHVWPTAQSLVDAYNRETKRLELIPLEDFLPVEPIEVKTVEQADEIFFCPECVHDF